MTATIDCGQGDWVSVDHWDNGATIEIRAFPAGRIQIDLLTPQITHSPQPSNPDPTRSNNGRHGWTIQLLERWAPEYGGGWTASLGRHNHPDGPGAQGWGPTPAAAVADALEVVARIENGEAKQ